MSKRRIHTHHIQRKMALERVSVRISDTPLLEKPPMLLTPSIFLEKPKPPPLFGKSLKTTPPPL